jgi:predicted metalloenzyme YecM
MAHHKDCVEQIKKLSLDFAAFKAKVEAITNRIGLDAIQVKHETVWVDPNNVTANLEQSQKNMERWFLELRELLK